MRKFGLLGRWLVAFVAVACAALVFMPGTSVAAPGNNGTIKIDGVPFDDAPDNEPHVGCTFQVDFYNYEQGPYTAAIKFVVQPPTGKDIVLKTGSVFIGGDAAGGGTDLDGSGTFSLAGTLQPFMAHPTQGYHVKLTIKAPKSAGADTKYKTFWVTGCGYI